MKILFYAGLGLGIAGLILLGFQARSLFFSGIGVPFIVPLSQLASTQVSCGGATNQATTSLWAAGLNLQRVYLDNLGNGNVYLGFGTNNATTSSGYHLYPVTSSTGRSYEVIDDPSLLNKGANCVGITTSTVNVFRY